MYILAGTSKPIHNWMVPFPYFIAWSVLTTGDTLITAIPQNFVSIAQLCTWWIAIAQQFITTIIHDQHCSTSLWILYKLRLEYSHKTLKLRFQEISLSLSSCADCWIGTPECWRLWDSSLRRWQFSLLLNEVCVSSELLGRAVEHVLGQQISP